MLTFDQVLNKYLEYFKKAYLNINASVIHRQSVLAKNECAVGFQHISKYFQDGKIESEFQQLQDKLKKLTNTQESYDQLYNQLFEAFDRFFFQKTNHLLETKRIFSFFKKNSTANKTLKDMILLDAINFSATADLYDFFATEFKEATLLVENEDEAAYKSLQKHFKNAAAYCLDRIDLSNHLEFFQVLDHLGLGESLYTQIVIEQSQQFSRIHHSLKDINLDIQQAKTSILKQSAANCYSTTYPFNPILSFFNFGLSQQQLELATAYHAYQTNVIKTVFNFLMSKQSVDELEKQLYQHENTLLSSTQLETSFTHLKGLHARIIEKITIKNQQPPPITDGHLFLSRQHTTGITFPEHLKIYS
ncbi:hypothetical protein [Piscirickettsia salmonis]|uniref:hypothetical protein n=1 Tax=Piscirickettsia salmonis TaxID=1238 RepID=UPI0007C953A2|nr:hypothetical protein A0O36_01583 [Piscirickettsiaceae bacterium NZ-RLO1]